MDWLRGKGLGFFIAKPKKHFLLQTNLVLFPGGNLFQFALPLQGKGRRMLLD